MCDCIKKANKALAERQTAIETVTALTAGGKFIEKLCIPTRSTVTGKRSRKPALKVFAAFCPLCGNRIEALPA